MNVWQQPVTTTCAHNTWILIEQIVLPTPKNVSRLLMLCNFVAAVQWLEQKISWNTFKQPDDHKRVHEFILRLTYLVLAVGIFLETKVDERLQESWNFSWLFTTTWCFEMCNKKNRPPCPRKKIFKLADYFLFFFFLNTRLFQWLRCHAALLIEPLISLVLAFLSRSSIVFK